MKVCSTQTNIKQHQMLINLRCYLILQRSLNGENQKGGNSSVTVAANMIVVNNV